MDMHQYLNNCFYPFGNYFALSSILMWQPPACCVLFLDAWCVSPVIGRRANRALDFLPSLPNLLLLIFSSVMRTIISPVTQAKTLGIILGSFDGSFLTLNPSAGWHSVRSDHWWTLPPFPPGFHQHYLLGRPLLGKTGTAFPFLYL